jgi:hypothetical protein
LEELSFRRVAGECPQDSRAACPCPTLENRAVKVVLDVPVMISDIVRDLASMVRGWQTKVPISDWGGIGDDEP